MHTESPSCPLPPGSRPCGFCSGPAGSFLQNSPKWLLKCCISFQQQKHRYDFFSSSKRNLSNDFSPHQTPLRSILRHKFQADSSTHWNNWPDSVTWSESEPRGILGSWWGRPERRVAWAAVPIGSVPKGPHGRWCPHLTSWDPSPCWAAVSQTRVHALCPPEHVALAVARVLGGRDTRGCVWQTALWLLTFWRSLLHPQQAYFRIQ